MSEELDRDKPLFNDAVLVQVKFPDHDKTVLLTVRVLQGTRLASSAGMGSGGGGVQREGVLHLEITDELDPFFLYTLQVGEDDYHQLKHDQCLRVDFSSFPRKFIELLESCRGNAPGAMSLGPARNSEVGGGTAELRSGEPSFLARLETAVTGGFSVFSLVETNPFKELTHLSLKFRAGNDAAIKTYLAARLRQLKAQVLSTSTALDDVRAALAGEAAERSRLGEECSALRLDRDRDLRDLRAAHSAELTSAREEGVRRAEEAAAARAAEVEALRRKAEADLEQISQRLRQSEQRREELTDLKFAHEAELREMRSKSEVGAAEREAASNDARELREANRALEARTFEAEREVERLRMQGAALTQQLADAKEMVEKSQALQAASGASVARLEDTQEAYKGSVVALQERLEASVSEINRGNAIIQKLQGQYRALRSKTKLRSEVIKQQEKLLAEHEASARASESKLHAAAAERRATEARAEGLQRELTACEGRLEESARLLASNQQVIKWLNKELNDAQMLPGMPTTSTGGAAPGAGVSFGGGLSGDLGEEIGGDYNYGGVGGETEVGVSAAGRGSNTPVGDGGVRDSGGRRAMFTAGLRESLTGDGGGLNLRGTPGDKGGDRDAYFSYRGEAMGGEEGGDAGGTGGMAEGTPDHAGHGGGYRLGRGGYSRIVTPESAGVADSATQESARFASKDGEEGGVGRRVSGEGIRSIPAF